MAAKFKVGDLVEWGTKDGAILFVHILEVTTQLCEAGIEQHSYIARPYHPSIMERPNPSGKPMLSVGLKYMIAKEMELGELYVPKAND